ncbi:MAG: putative metallopeptidase [Bryobacteraceae bacterium]
MSQRRRLAPSEVVGIAEQVIDEHHEPLREVPVVIYMTDTAKTIHGRPALAYARKLTNHERFYLAKRTEEGLYIPNAGSGFCENEEGYSELMDGFAICIHDEAWADLSEHHRVALMDHELCHCEVETVETEFGFKLVCKMKGHDVEEFYEVIERHGDWMGEVKVLREKHLSYAKTQGQALLELFENSLTRGEEPRGEAL